MKEVSFALTFKMTGSEAIPELKVHLRDVLDKLDWHGNNFRPVIIPIKDDKDRIIGEFNRRHEGDSRMKPTKMQQGYDHAAGVLLRGNTDNVRRLESQISERSYRSTPPDPPYLRGMADAYVDFQKLLNDRR